MINRSLIRIKTVQILYSYLLTRSDFRLAPAPDAEASRDRRFAYSVHQEGWMHGTISIFLYLLRPVF